MKRIPLLTLLVIQSTLAYGQSGMERTLVGALERTLVVEAARPGVSGLVVRELAGQGFSGGGTHIYQLSGSYLRQSSLANGRASGSSTNQDMANFEEAGRANPVTSNPLMDSIKDHLDPSYVVRKPTLGDSISAGRAEEDLAKATVARKLSPDYPSNPTGLQFSTSSVAGNTVVSDGGHAASSESELVKDFLTGRYANNAEKRTAEDSAFRLQRSNPDFLICQSLMTRPAETRQRVQDLSTFVLHDPGDIIVVKPGPTFAVVDYKMVNIEGILRQSGVRVLTFDEATKWPFGSSKVVFVLTGHTSRAFANYVQALGDAGVFRDNIVVLNTCDSDTTRNLLDLINDRYQAVATFCYEGNIPSVRVQDLLVDLGAAQG